MDKATETKKSSTITISETQIKTTVKDKDVLAETTLSSDGVRFTSQSLRNQSENQQNHRKQSDNLR